jgi:hypothetical protein
MKYKAKKDYDKGDGLAQFGDIQRHLVLLKGGEVEITKLPKGYEEFIEPVKVEKVKGDK